jgi:hypothetical protein
MVLSFILIKTVHFRVHSPRQFRVKVRVSIPHWRRSPRVSNSVLLGFAYIALFSYLLMHYFRTYAVIIFSTSMELQVKFIT